MLTPGGTRRKKARPTVEEPEADFTGEEIRLVAAARLVPHPDKVTHPVAHQTPTSTP